MRYGWAYRTHGRPGYANSVILCNQLSMDITHAKTKLSSDRSQWRFSFFYGSGCLRLVEGDSVHEAIMQCDTGGKALLRNTRNESVCSTRSADGGEVSRISS